MGAFDAIVVCMSMPDFTASVTGVLSHTSDNFAFWAASSDSDNITLRSMVFPAAPSRSTSDTATVPIFQPFRSAYMRSVRVRRPDRLVQPAHRRAFHAGHTRRFADNSHLARDR